MKFIIGTNCNNFISRNYHFDAKRSGGRESRGSMRGGGDIEDCKHVG